jgi:sulfite oxidase
MSSRREFVKLLSAGALAAHFSRFAAAAGEQPAIIPGKPGMIIRSDRFLDLETPAELLNSWITPAEHFFVRNHMFEPTTVDAGTWRLTVGGEVERPLELRYSELKNFPPAAVVNTLECAGNGRAFFEPRVPGVQWQKGAVGTARYAGIRLRDVLARAGVKSSGKHVMLRGLDEVPGKVPPFIRSLPLEKALHPDTLIATHMNGRTLLKHHGFPARVLAPGWIGAASCKWITEIRVLPEPFVGNFMSPGYRMPNRTLKPGESVDAKDTSSITRLNVKAIITRPAEGAKLKRTVLLAGAAWAGEEQVSKVEISADEGAGWHEATLGRERAAYAWRLWTYAWRPDRSGERVILARATDTSGRTQPDRAAWNPSGYLYNAADRVKVYVEA